MCNRSLKLLQHITTTIKSSDAIKDVFLMWNTYEPIIIKKSILLNEI